MSLNPNTLGEDLQAAHPGLVVCASSPLKICATIGARYHAVTIGLKQQWWRISGRIADPEAVPNPPTSDALLGQILVANQRAEMVVLGSSESGMLEAYMDIPDDANIGEMLDAVWAVARAADRWELLWTGKDIY